MNGWKLKINQTGKIKRLSLTDGVKGPNGSGLERLPVTVSFIHAGLSLQMLQQTLGPPQGLRTRQRPAQVVHQPVETGVVRRLLEVFRTLVQPGAQDGGQGTAEPAGKEKGNIICQIWSMWNRPGRTCANAPHFLIALLVSEL